MVWVCIFSTRLLKRLDACDNHRLYPKLSVSPHADKPVLRCVLEHPKLDWPERDIGCSDVRALKHRVTLCLTWQETHVNDWNDLWIVVLPEKGKVRSTRLTNADQTYLKRRYAVCDVVGYNHSVEWMQGVRITIWQCGRVGVARERACQGRKYQVRVFVVIDTIES